MRVFEEIITGNLIEPKLKKTDIENLGFEEITQLATEIINFSLRALGFELKEDFSINAQIYDYEKMVFQLTERQEIFLKNKINYAAAVELIEEGAVFNLRWLKSLATKKCSAENRAR